MRKFFFSSCIVLALLIGGSDTKAQDTLAYWGLNETSGTVTKESVSNTEFTIKTKWPLIERVPGIRQQALRTDGYTFFVEGNSNAVLPQDSFSVSAWIALETYPVNTAAIWTNVDPVTDRGAFVAIDKFGRLAVRFTVGAQVVNFTSTATVQHYRWTYVVVNINAVSGNITGYVNAVKFIDQSFSPGSLSWPSVKTFLGRSSSDEKQDIFPLNYLNGILDEIIVRKKILSVLLINNEYNLLNPSKAADLSVPASRFAFDFHRPKYHPAPQSSWANESHGLIFHNGVYHMFYQKNGNGPYFSQQNWGHLISVDLVNWQEKQVALWPQPGGFETVGIWSGHLVKDDAGIPTIFYTAVDGVKAGIGSAVSGDNLLTWQRNPLNPLIPAAPATYPNKDFRDPYVFKDGSTWYMIIGTGLQSPQTGTVFLYKSTDLLSWQLTGPLFIDESFLNDPGIFWEMPVFWKFGGKYMLLVNKVPVPGTPAKAFYWVGDFDGSKFIPSNHRSQNLEIINSLLSPTVNFDDQNRVTAIGIIPDLLPGSEQYENGWANIFSLPRVWQMIDDTLHQSPHPYLEKARGAATLLNNISVQPAGSNYLNVRGWQMEIKATINPGTATQTGFIVGQNDTKTEFTKIWYDYQNQKMIVDRTKSSTNPNTPRDIQSEFFSLPAGQSVEWHLFIDRSVIEVFINNRWAFATRIYPTDITSNKVDLFSAGGNATASAVQIWDRGNLVTGIFDPAPEYKMTKAWPVPACEKCYIQLPANITGSVNLQFYDVAGRLVRQIKQQATAAVKFIEWNLRGDNGIKVPAGNYYCTLTVNNTSFYQAKLLVINK